MSLSMEKKKIKIHFLKNCEGYYEILGNNLTPSVEWEPNLNMQSSSSSAACRYMKISFNLHTFPFKPPEMAPM
jgi:hypothetical protein